MKFNLIIPIAADRPEYKDTMPYLFSERSGGLMPCIKSITGMDLSVFDAVYFTLLKSHDVRYSLKAEFQKQLEDLGLGSKSHLVFLEHPTASQPATIAQTIYQVQLTGAVMIKDADSYFTSEIVPENSITTFPLDAMTRVNPQDKSYVAVDDMFYVTNVIEKKIINRLFCSGGYIFESVEEYCKYYECLKCHSPLYLSHIIYAMLLDKYLFRPVPVKGYQDWGTREDWLESNK